MYPLYSLRERTDAEDTQVKQRYDDKSNENHRSNDWHQEERKENPDSHEVRDPYGRSGQKSGRDGLYMDEKTQNNYEQSQKTLFEIHLEKVLRITRRKAKSSKAIESM